MTARRYQRGSQQRSLQDHDEAISALQFGNPLPTFRASITNDFDDITTERRQYFAVSGTPGTDTVFWDYWDETYDRRFFEPFIQSSGPDAGRIGAVDLLVPGLYAIRATIDWNTEDLNMTGGLFGTWIGSNYDDGGLTYIPMDLTTDILGAWALDNFRIVWPSFTGSEGWVEITATHDNVAEEPLYIPGGFAGYWGMPPHLTIAYLGGLGTEPTYFSDV